MIDFGGKAALRVDVDRGLRVPVGCFFTAAGRAADVLRRCRVQGSARQGKVEVRGGKDAVGGHARGGGSGISVFGIDRVADGGKGRGQMGQSIVKSIF